METYKVDRTEQNAITLVEAFHQLSQPYGGDKHYRVVDIASMLAYLFSYTITQDAVPAVNKEGEEYFIPVWIIEGYSDEESMMTAKAIFSLIAKVHHLDPIPGERRIYITDHDMAQEFVQVVKEADATKPAGE